MGVALALAVAVAVLLDVVLLADTVGVDDALDDVAVGVADALEDEAEHKPSIDVGRSVTPPVLQIYDVRSRSVN